MPTARTAGANLFERMADLQALAREKGHAPIPVSISDPDPDPSLLDDYQKAGTARVILRVPDAGSDELLPLLDQYAELARRYVWSASE